MPSEIGNSVVNPVAFVRPSPQQAQADLRAREDAQASGGRPQASPPAGPETLVRPPEADPQGQPVENQLASNNGAASRPGADAESRPVGPPEGGVGGNVDLLI